MQAGLRDQSLRSWSAVIVWRAAGKKRRRRKRRRKRRRRRGVNVFESQALRKRCVHVRHGGPPQQRDKQFAFCAFLTSR